MAEPLRGYVICSNPRSGSTYLVMLLRSTKVLGTPYEWLRGDGGLADPWTNSYTTDPLKQIEHVKREGATANGIYGLKMFPEHFDQHIASRWCETLPRLQYIYLIRRDLLAQAISLSIARQTVEYATWMTPVAEARYDRNHIQTCLNFLAVGEARWRAFFAVNGLTPLTLTYEELEASPQDVVTAVAQFMNVDNALIDVDSFRMDRQRGAITDEWRSRFLSEAADLTRLPALDGSVRA